jgi:hypothetical protein
MEVLLPGSKKAVYLWLALSTKYVSCLIPDFLQTLDLFNYV